MIPVGKNRARFCIYIYRSRHRLIFHARNEIDLQKLFAPTVNNQTNPSLQTTRLSHLPRMYHRVHDVIVQTQARQAFSTERFQFHAIIGINGANMEMHRFARTTNFRTSSGIVGNIMTVPRVYIYTIYTYTCYIVKFPPIQLVWVLGGEEKIQETRIALHTLNLSVLLAHGCVCRNCIRLARYHKRTMNRAPSASRGRVVVLNCVVVRAA